MWTVFIMQWKRLIKQPFIVLTFFGLTLLFVTFLGQSQTTGKIEVQTYTTELSEEAYYTLIEELNGSDQFAFRQSDRQTVEDRIKNNRLSFAVELNETSFSFLVGQSSFSQPLVRDYLAEIYQKNRWLKVNDLTEGDLNEYIPFETSFVSVADDSVHYQTQVVVGMTLYFVMYTVLFQLMTIAEQKTDGTWDRMMLSPVSKKQIFSGLFLYYYFIGLIQVGLSFIIFTQWLGFSFGDKYGLLLLSMSLFLMSIVALGLMLVSLVKTPQQLQAVIPIVATASAMLGGAFWPLEFVTQPVLLFFSRIIPIRYGIETLSDVILRDVSFGELLSPYVLLLALTILFGGIGLYFLERKHD